MLFTRKILGEVLHMWAREEVPAELPKWSAFRHQVQSGLQKIMEATEQGSHVLAVTSGGVTAASVGLALELSDEKILDLIWPLRNSSFSEFLFSGQRFSLNRLNVFPHITDDAMLTYV